MSNIHLIIIVFDIQQTSAVEGKRVTKDNPDKLRIAMIGRKLTLIRRKRLSKSSHYDY